LDSDLRMKKDFQLPPPLRLCAVCEKKSVSKKMLKPKEALQQE